MLARGGRKPLYFRHGMSEDKSVSEIVVGRTVFRDVPGELLGDRQPRTREAICVDPGDEADEILAMARTWALEIKYIANSHAHIDHIAGVGAAPRGDRREGPAARRRP